MQKDEASRMQIKKRKVNEKAIVLITLAIVAVLLAVAAWYLLSRQNAASTEDAGMLPAVALEIPTSETMPVETQADLLPDTLSDDLDTVLADAGGTWAVYVEALETGEILRKGDCSGKMIAASIVKIFAMATVYDLAERGELKMTDSLERNVYNMIVVSDNASTNSVLETLGNGSAEAGMRVVKDYAVSIGCEASEFNRRMGVENGLENYISADDCAVLLRMIYDGTCVNAERSAHMMDLLLENIYADFIPAGVPEDVKVAHKGGDLDTRCRGDVGIVFLDGNPYIVCIIANKVPNAGDACRKIPVVSETIWNAMSSVAVPAADAEPSN